MNSTVAKGETATPRLCAFANGLPTGALDCIRFVIVLLFVDIILEENIDAAAVALGNFLGFNLIKNLTNIPAAEKRNRSALSTASVDPIKDEAEEISKEAKFAAI